MTKPTGRLGLRDVARHAKISLATASRAISQPELVSEAVRARVQQASLELGYIPNRVARRLGSSRAEIIGLIVPSIGNPLFAPAIDGVRNVLDEHGYGMLINSAERDPDRELRQVQTLIEHGVDALLTMLPEHRPELFKLIEQVGLKTVYIETTPQLPPGPSIRYDNAGAMREMVEYVVAAGHRKIAVLSGPRASTPVIAERLQVAQEALQQAGLEPRPKWIVEADYDVPLMRLAARDLLTQAERPTAIVCTGDQHAVSVIVEAQALGINVPGDLSVTGCNDVAIAQLCHPMLTTQRLPYREMGETACRIALDLLHGKTVPECTMLQHSLIVRGSVGRPIKE